MGGMTSDSPAETATRGEREVARLAFGGGLNLLGAVVNQASLFGITLILARWLGTAEVGVYFQAFAVRSLLQLVCLGGMRSALTRYVALYRVDGDDASVLGAVYLGIGSSVAGSALVAVALWAASPFLAEQFFSEPALVEPLRLVAVSLPSAVLTVAALSATQGFRTMRPFSLVGLIFEPAARVVLTVVLLAAGLGLRGAMVALVVAGVATSVIATVWLWRLLGEATKQKPRYAVREISRFAAVSWISSVAAQGLLWVDIVLLGAFLASEEVGVYQVATRLVTVAALAVNPLNSSFAPRAADLFRRKDVALLARSYSATISWMLRISLPAFVALAVFPQELLRVFGNEYVVGSTVVLIFVWGELAEAATSSAAVVLNMAGRNLVNMLDGVAVLALNIGLNILLIPRWGIEGAAVAWTVGLVLIGALRVTQARAVVHIFPFRGAAVRGVAAGVVALGVGVLVKVTTDSLVSLVLGLAAIAVTYVLVLLRLGISEDDWSVLRAVQARIRPAR